MTWWVSADETIDDALLARGSRVIVDGVVTGDLIAGARAVVIRGTVHGNVISWSQSLDVEGEGRRLGVRGGPIPLPCKAR